MRKKWFLTAIMLGVILCFVVSGVGYGEIPEWALESKVTYIDVKLSEIRIDYIMMRPNDFLNTRYAYDSSGSLAKFFPTGISTKDKITILIMDIRNVFSNKSASDLLTQFETELSYAYFYLEGIATDKSNDIVVKFLNKQGKTIGYFYQGKYHLWEE